MSDQMVALHFMYYNFVGASAIKCWCPVANPPTC